MTAVFRCWRASWGASATLAVLPSGEHVWLSFPGGEMFTAVAPVRQFQMIQHAVEEIEVRLVLDGPLTATQEERLRRNLNARIGTAFGVRFSYVDEIAHTPDGEFKNFICMIGA